MIWDERVLRRWLRPPYPQPEWSKRLAAEREAERLREEGPPPVVPKYEVRDVPIDLPSGAVAVDADATGMPRDMTHYPACLDASTKVD